MKISLPSPELNEAELPDREPSCSTPRDTQPTLRKRASHLQGSVWCESAAAIASTWAQILCENDCTALHGESKRRMHRKDAKSDFIVVDFRICGKVAICIPAGGQEDSQKCNQLHCPRRTTHPSISRKYLGGKQIPPDTPNPCYHSTRAAQHAFHLILIE